jgi:hypothetical protein
MIEGTPDTEEEPAPDEVRDEQSPHRPSVGWTSREAEAKVHFKAKAWRNASQDETYVIAAETMPLPALVPLLSTIGAFYGKAAQALQGTSPRVEAWQVLAQPDGLERLLLKPISSEPAGFVRHVYVFCSLCGEWTPIRARIGAIAVHCASEAHRSKVAAFEGEVSAEVAGMAWLVLAACEKVNALTCYESPKYVQIVKRSTGGYSLHHRQLTKLICETSDEILASADSLIALHGGSVNAALAWDGQTLHGDASEVQGPINTIICADGAKFEFMVALKRPADVSAAGINNGKIAILNSQKISGGWRPQVLSDGARNAKATANQVVALERTGYCVITEDVGKRPVVSARVAPQIAEAITCAMHYAALIQAAFWQNAAILGHRRPVSHWRNAADTRNRASLHQMHCNSANATRANWDGHYRMCVNC